jgi:rRNA maturation RNase YbeY
MSDVPSPGLVIEQAHPTRDVDLTTLRDVLHHVVDAEGASVQFLSVVLAGHDTIRPLNRDHLGHDYNTDVLSFPLAEPGDDPPVVNGEIYVDLDTAAERHDEFDTTYEREAYRYAIHGLLHLLGYDDATPDGQSTMRALEDRYLAPL